MSATVVQLRPKPSTFQQAWELCPTLMRTRSSTKEAAREWNEARKEAGEDALLAALRRYLDEDEDVRRWRSGRNAAGPPGFHRWLKWRRWENWISSPTSAEQDENICPFRARLIEALGEAFVRSYIDRFEIENGLLLVSSDTAAERLLQHRQTLRACGLRGMKRVPRAPA